MPDLQWVCGVAFPQLYWSIMTTKTLDVKLARILADSSCRDFILADAKDADMAFGIASPGRSPEHHAQEGRFRSLDEYRELIRQNVRQGLVDIMLMSASTNEVLTHPRAAVRLQPRHAGDPGQRHDRHLAGPGRPIYKGAGAALPLGLDRPGDVRQAAVRAARADAGRGPGPLLGHVQQRPRPRPSHARCLSGVPRGGGGQGLPALPRGLRSQRRRRPPSPTWPDSSTT